MKKITAVLSALLIGVITAGCDQTKTEDWYLGHHDELIKKLDECMKNQDRSSAECINVRNASRTAKNEPDVAEGIKNIQKRMWQESAPKTVEKNHE